MSARTAWPAVVAASSLLAVGVVALGAWAPVRGAVVAWFLLAVPGGAFVPLLALRDRVAEVTVAIALSLALDLVVACAMLYAGAWSATGGIAALAAIALSGAALEVRPRKRRHAVAVAVAHPSAPVCLALRRGPAAPLSLNRATAEQLDAIDGVGPATARRIVAWRAVNGAFRSVDELARVRGIGPRLIAELRGRVRP